MKSKHAHRFSGLRAGYPLVPILFVAGACELVASVDRGQPIGGGSGGQVGLAGEPGAAAQSGASGAAGSGGAGSGATGGELGIGGEGASDQGGAAQGGAAQAMAGEGGAAAREGGEGGASPGMAGGAGEGPVGGEGGQGSTAGGKVLYLTAMPKKANFGGIVGADAQCNAGPPRPGTYKALLVDGESRVACTTAGCSGGVGEHTDWVLAPETTYVRPDGTVIGVTSAAGVFVFPLQASFTGAGYSYWTGLSADWTSSTDDCNGWSQTAGFFANEGLADATDSQAIMGVSESCATLAGAFFACVEQ